MKVKIEIELENGDLVTLIKSFASLFSKIDLSKLTPPPEVVVKPYVGDTQTVTVNDEIDVTYTTAYPDGQNAEIDKEVYIYDDGSGNKTIVDEKKNEES